ncbi:MAG: hypothetical protein ABIJ57_01085, partial [Pseudomonadota bacterium]
MKLGARDQQLCDAQLCRASFAALIFEYDIIIPMSSIFFQKISIDEFINNINLLITKAGGAVAFSRAVDVSYA